jgi:hypothetical protein
MIPERDRHSTDPAARSRKWGIAMSGKPTEINDAAKRLREIMLGYLEAAGWFAFWPGGDGLTLDDALDCYPTAIAKGVVPDWQQLLSRHADLDVELHLWLAAKDRWRFAFCLELPGPLGRPGEPNHAQ